MLFVELSEKYPGSAEMFSKYLSKDLFLPQLGHLQRMCESADQYANRLLSQNKSLAEGDSARLANHFVNHYKDHGFVIDCDEAQQLLGKATVKINEKEYKFANSLYNELDLVVLISSIFKDKAFSFVGDITSGATLKNIEKKTKGATP